ncbi:MAG: GNAT family N-acetyltransferase [Candidatus Roizmanbacteria bacterium]|nr:MAG: GNAT family N-acetyltransferase [Candidatus Roizmanbacteria bacterium]
MEMQVRSKTEKDTEWIKKLFINEWGSEVVLSNNKIYKPEEVLGIIVEHDNKKVGLLTFIIDAEKIEIITLNSLEKNRGIGTLLIDELKKIAQEERCKRIILETTNENISALSFYQKRGFQIIAVYPNAINEARKTKPEIPLVGENGIPIRDALELELKLA